MMRVLLAAMMAVFLVGSSTARAQTGPVRKPVVSIDDIQDLANTGQAPVLRQMIETTVVNTGKFRIMERSGQGMGVLLAEQARAKAGLVTTNTPGKVGGFEGVDFKVYGTITTASASNTRNVGASAGMSMGSSLASRLPFFGGPLSSVMSSNSNCTDSAASLAVDVRITDGSTGELKYAKHVVQPGRGGTVCGGQSQVDMPDLMRAAAQRVSMGLVTIMYPVKVVDLGEDGQLVFNYGEGLLAPGDIYAVFRQGKRLIDPDTGAVLGNSETFLGLTRITDVMPKMSKAAMLTTFSSPPSPGSVAREATPDQLKLLTAVKR